MSPFYDFGQDSVKENIGVTLVERTGRRDVVPFIPLFHGRERGKAAFSPCLLLRWSQTFSSTLLSLIIFTIWAKLQGICCVIIAVTKG